MRITKKVEFDYGHRIPSHKSKCRHFHGHRGVLYCTIEGPIKAVRGESDDGMVADFSDLKALMTHYIHDWWDHAFLVYEGDHDARRALSYMEDTDLAHRTVVLPVVPTSENLAQFVFRYLAPEVTKAFGDSIKLVSVVFYETPNSYAEITLDSDLNG